jgi:hypothetical protein
MNAVPPRTSRFLLLTLAGFPLNHRGVDVDMRAALSYVRRHAAVLGIDAFRRRALELGADVCVLTRPRVVDGFDVSNPDARSREILKRAVAFVRAQL